MLEWQKFTQDSSEVPHYKDLLEFLSIRAQGSESSLADTKKVASIGHRQKTSSNKQFSSFAASAADTENSTCMLCKNEKHPLFACSHFKGLSCDKKISMLKSQYLCLNCLHLVHFVRWCKSQHHCRMCEKAHHTLRHVDQGAQNVPCITQSQMPGTNVSSSVTTPGLLSRSLLMICCIHWCMSLMVLW